MGAQGAEINNQVCDAHEDALLHVAKPRELLCDETDKDVERWLSIVITACLVVIACAELLSLSPHAHAASLQGGEGAEDASNCTSLFAKKSPIIGLFCGKSPVQMRYPMHPRHPVFVFYSPRWGWSSRSPTSATASLCSHVGRFSGCNQRGWASNQREGAFLLHCAISSAD